MNKLNIEYKTENDTGIDEAFDKDIESLAEQYGLEFIGSGFNLNTRVRDLSFKEKK